jgi:hypothetical protein
MEFSKGIGAGATKVLLSEVLVLAGAESTDGGWVAGDGAAAFGGD